MKPLTVEEIAEICHEANRLYSRSQGDESHKVWSETAWALKQSAIAGVCFLQDNPEARLDSLHENWRKHKATEGWVYGEDKDDTKLTHPCMVAYEQLPALHQCKDALFRSIVKALTPGGAHD